MSDPLPCRVGKLLAILHGHVEAGINNDTRVATCNPILPCVFEPSRYPNFNGHS